MEKIKVVCIIPSILTGGAEKMAIDLVAYLNKELFDVYLISLYKDTQSVYSKFIDERNVSISYLDKKAGLDFITFKNLSKKLSEYRPDIIHTHLNASIYAIPWINQNKNVKWIHTIHNEAAKEFPKVYLNIMKYFYKKKMATPIAISERIKVSISEQYKIRKEEIPLIYNGVDTETFKPFKIENREKVVFCCVARFSYQKNHKILIDAFYRAVSKTPNISLILVGDGELRPEIEKQIEDYGIRDKVTLVGNTNDVLRYLQKSDVFVLSSRYEGLPLSVLEAMSAGLAILATRVGGIPDVVSDGEEGLLVSPGNSASLASAMVKIASEDQDRLNMRFKSLEKAKDFDVRRMAKLYEKIYSK